MTPNIPSFDSDLRIDKTTERSAILEFIDSRVRQPAVVGDAMVWNFHSRDFDAAALVNADLPEGRYVVPYQVSGVWAFMSDVLPSEVSRATLLTYRASEGTYEQYQNYCDSPSLEEEMESLKYSFYIGLQETYS